ncbi:MAG: M23 family metallopeptidase [Microbacterium sp.]|uniref:M23 family metallopeptidase n=1 Tax=Microbacterium sp. TaxID=51671 RepID=UPI0039E4F838
MAEDIDSSATEHETTASLATRSRARQQTARRSTAVAASTRPASRQPAAGKSARKPLRSLATVAIVAGLVATVAIPAYGAFQPAAETKTVQQLAQEDAQSMIVASEVKASGLERDSYSATTEEEIAKKKAAEAAAARAREAAASGTPVNVDLDLIGPGSGDFRWPLAKITRIGDGYLSRGGAHMGVDLISPGGTPIFASADGVVRVSQESYFGYGVCITIDSVINGRRVNTLYSHMRYGTRTVGVGDRVKAGQVIGLVGATGRAYGNHLHYEVQVNGSRVDPLAFLRANAG